MTEDLPKKIDDLVARHRGLLARRDSLQMDKGRVEAELEARKRILRKLMEEAKREGFDPNNLRSDLQRTAEVLQVKLDAFEADLQAGEKMIKPMLEEMRKG